MSGALSPLGTSSFSGSLQGFMDLLQHASYRYVPFSVLATGTTAGRRMAIHEYPFRDGVVTEDLGRRGRLYRFTGYVLGVAGPLLEQQALKVAELPGKGQLIHPTIGAKDVVCLSLSTSVRADRQRVIELNWEFLEAGESSFVMTVIATAVQVLAAVSSGISTSSAAFGRIAAPAAAMGGLATAAGVEVTNGFAAQVLAAAADGAGALRAVAGLPGANYGRYASGALGVPQLDGTTVASALAARTTARVAVASAAAAAAAASASVAAGADLVAALAALVEALRLSFTDPADQIRLLLGLAGYSWKGRATCSTGVGAAIAALRGATVVAARRAVALSLASAAAAYRPSSYQDAVTVQQLVTAVLDDAVTAAGDAGDDDVYQALRAVRVAVVTDLATRGGTLAQVRQVQLRQSMPALWAAQRLYADGSRADELIARANPVHPAFMPVSFEALAT